MTRHAVVQIAVDVMTIEQAVPQIDRAVAAGADWVELGRPLLDGLGLRGIRSLIRSTDVHWLLDAMVLAAPQRYVEMLSSCGIGRITVAALAPRATVLKAIEVYHSAGVEVVIDLFNVPDPVGAGRDYASRGADSVMVHIGVDQKAADPSLDATEVVRELSRIVSIPVGTACYSADEGRRAVAAGAQLVVLGEFADHLAADALHSLVSELHDTHVSEQQKGTP